MQQMYSRNGVNLMLHVKVTNAYFNLQLLNNVKSKKLVYIIRKRRDGGSKLNIYNLLNNNMIKSKGKFQTRHFFHLNISN